MSAFLDDVSRIIARPISRRQTLRLVCTAVGGAVLASLGLGTACWGSGSPAPEPQGSCPNGQTPCGSGCCQRGNCCKGKICCNSNQSCCGTGNTPKCCAPGKVCCSGQCCTAGPSPSKPCSQSSQCTWSKAQEDSCLPGTRRTQT